MAEQEIYKKLIETFDYLSNIPQYAEASYYFRWMPVKYLGPGQMAATDGVNLYIGDMFVNLPLEQRAFVVIHELWHIISGDMINKDDKEMNYWNIATDLINNYIITRQKIKDIYPPSGILLDPKYNDSMTKDMLYRLIKEWCETQGYFILNGEKIYCQPSGGGEGEGKEGEGKGMGKGVGRGAEKKGKGVSRNPGNSIPDINPGDLIDNPDLTPDDLGDAVRKFVDSVKKYRKDHAEGAGKGSVFDDYVYREVEPKVPWYSIIQKYFQQLAKGDYTWIPPKVQYGAGIKLPYTEPFIYTPRLRSKEIKIAIAIDTSGSIEKEWVDMFLSELRKLSSVIFQEGQATTLLMLTTDEVYYYTTGSLNKISNPYTISKHVMSGGTSFIPAFDMVHKLWFDRLDLFIYFTDGEGAYPSTPPRYPVIWVITTDIEKLKRSNNYPPFGQVIPV